MLKNLSNLGPETCRFWNPNCPWGSGIARLSNIANWLKKVHKKKSCFMHLPIKNGKERNLRKNNRKSINWYSNSCYLETLYTIIIITITYYSTKYHSHAHIGYGEDPLNPYKNPIDNPHLDQDLVILIGNFTYWPFIYTYLPMNIENILYGFEFLLIKVEYNYYLYHNDYTDKYFRTAFYSRRI